MKLRAENIMKAYRGRKVVKGISLEVNQGEIVGLLHSDDFFAHNRVLESIAAYFEQLRQIIN